MPDFYNDMESLGRDAAEHFQPKVQAPSWEAVATRLEDELPVAKKRRSIWWMAFPVLLILAPGIMGDGVFRQDGKKGGSSKPVNAPENKGQMMAGGGAVMQEESPSDFEVPQKKKGNKANNFSDKNTSLQNGEKGMITKGGMETKGKKNERQLHLAEKEKQDDGIAPGRPVEWRGKLMETPAFKAETDRAIGYLRNNLARNAIDALQDSMPRCLAENKKTARWELSLVAGADKSSDGFTHADHPGLNLGITVGYAVGKKWTIRTGLVYTKKKYTVNGNQYDFKFGYAYPDHTLNQVSGYCNMWEIPLNIRWTATPDKRTSLFLSGGLSTYLMVKEKYDFMFTNPYSTINRTRTYNDTKTYPLGVAHLSAGIRTQITQKIAISIEPFAKIPLRGVGSGNLRLTSLGGYGMVHWKF